MFQGIQEYIQNKNIKKNQEKSRNSTTKNMNMIDKVLTEIKALNLRNYSNKLITNLFLN